MKAIKVIRDMLAGIGAFAILIGLGAAAILYL